MNASLANIDTLIFDFDGTLADTMDLGIKISNKLSERYGYKKINSREELESYREMKTQDALKAIGISKIKLPLIAHQFRKELSKEINSLHPIAQVKDMLDQLAAHYSMGIVTSNSAKNIHKFLKVNHIDDHFKFFSTGISLFKKDANIKTLLKKNKLKKEQVLLIGDETRDIEAARDAKVMVMAVSWGFHKKCILENLNPDIIVEHPREVCELLISQ